MFTTFTALFLFFTLNDIKLKFQKEAQLIEEKQLEIKKSVLEKEVKRYVDFIEYKKEPTYIKFYKLIILLFVTIILLSFLLSKKEKGNNQNETDEISIEKD